MLRWKLIGVVGFWTVGLQNAEFEDYNKLINDDFANTAGGAIQKTSIECRLNAKDHTPRGTWDSMSTD